MPSICSVTRRRRRPCCTDDRFCSIVITFSLSPRGLGGAAARTLGTRGCTLTRLFVQPALLHRTPTVGHDLSTARRETALRQRRVRQQRRGLPSGSADFVKVLL